MRNLRAEKGIKAKVLLEHRKVSVKVRTKKHRSDEKINGKREIMKLV